MEKVDPGTIPYDSIWWTAFVAFDYSNAPGAVRRQAVDNFIAAINAAMGGHAIDRDDGPYYGVGSNELAAIAAHEAKRRGVPVATINFLIAVHSAV